MAEYNRKRTERKKKKREKGVKQCDKAISTAATKHGEYRTKLAWLWFDIVTWLGGSRRLGPPLVADVGILHIPFRLSIAPIRPVNCRLRVQPSKGNRRLYLLRHSARTMLPMRLFVLPHQGSAVFMQPLTRYKKEHRGAQRSD